MKKDFIKLPLVLFLISGIVTALLAFANSVTAPVIEKRNEQSVNEARESVLSGAKDFQSVDYKNDEVSELVREKSGKGYCASVSVKGYGGDINMIVGVEPDGTVTGVKIISMSETAGLGAKTNDEKWLSQFVGGSGEFKVSKDGGEIDAVTAATISSRAVSKGVTAASQAVKEVEEIEE